jgi:hypothetical protein
MAAFRTPGSANSGDHLSSGEILTIRDMATLAFAVLGRPPRYRQWPAAMAEYMKRSLVSDHGEAARGLASEPGVLVLSAVDVAT